MPLPPPPPRLFVGGQFWTVRGEPCDISGDVCYSAVHGLPYPPADPRLRSALLDSGAFSDPPGRRLSFEAALERQLAWEARASTAWGVPWRAEALVSYDLLIDERWDGPDGQRRKQRWAVDEAEPAVEVTVAAARYLADRRAELAPRHLVLSCQGVDARQYEACAARVLEAARPGDWLGLGGWCILGRRTRLLPEYRETIHRVLPMTAAAGLGQVHVFGVLYLPALGELVWLADRHGLKVSTDSTRPVLNCTWKDAKKAGVRAEGWKDNLRWWREAVEGIRGSVYYREPKRSRQGTLFS
jgi:hypothetical protein